MSIPMGLVNITLQTGTPPTTHGSTSDGIVGTGWNSTAGNGATRFIIEEVRVGTAHVAG